MAMNGSDETYCPTCAYPLVWHPTERLAVLCETHKAELRTIKRECSRVWQDVAYRLASDAERSRLAAEALIRR